MPNDVWLIDDAPVTPRAQSTLEDPFSPEQPRRDDLWDNDEERGAQDLYFEMDDLDNDGHRRSPLPSHSTYHAPNDVRHRRDFNIVHLWRRLRGKAVDPSSMGPRRVVFPPSGGEKFRGNHISTTKYNVATFIPKFLFEQFSKYANLFFLATACIQQVPHVSPTNRYTTIGTLAIVLLTSAIKELVEDFKRFSADKELNNSKTWVFNTQHGQWEPKNWNKIRVGDLVKVENEQQVPADVIVLSTSEPEGLCYIETSNLDGETNLKIKQSNVATNHLCDEQQLRDLRLVIESEHPNSSLYTYEGTLEVENHKKISLNPDQMLLRGTSVRNTRWIMGIVVFTGHETKLMRNATATPIKRTAVEHMLNLQIIFLFGILLVMAILSAAGNVITMSRWRESMWYLQLQSASLTSTFFLDLLTFWILFSNLVPISLFVTVEIIKYYQAFLISSDLEMYDRETDTPTVCRTSSLVEELGQIGYIFSDKTGTLTRNIMEFKSCSIAGRCYAYEIPEDKRGTDIEYYTMDQLRQDMDDPRLGPDIDEFFTLLATCHTVIPEMREDGSLKYQASSPDEGALVDGAAALGYVFTVRKPSSVFIEVRGQEKEYELLNICEFNSTRKRMSTIFRCPDGKIRLFCKGADTVIFERLKEGEGPLIDATMSNLEEFASEGLRTLCLAYREISEKAYEGWAREYDAAVTSLDNRQEKVDAAAAKIEKNLELVGATAIEDKLQEGVPDTIHMLQEAGIKIWVLTGDRQETAINIGMSCKLLSEDMNLLIVNEDTLEKTRQNIRNKLEIMSNQTTAADLSTLALVIDGASLGFALSPSMEKEFLELAVSCKSVICCRVSPLQKALVVKLVKRHLKSLLLAIGDGANDVSMIQAAHVGVGISGMEGQQAARSADVSIGQFRYLKKLLLVHGSWNYNRLSQAILYSFYKNIALYLTQFWYVFFNGFSGESIYESWTVTFYNVICTVLPPFCLGIFDQFVSARMLQQYPQLYRLGQDGVFLNVTHFWQWISNGIYHSIIIYFASIGIYYTGNVLTNGEIANQWTWGTATFTACVLTAIGKAGLVTNMWNKYTVIAIPGSFLIWMVFFPFYASVFPHANVSREYRGVLSALYPTLVFWAMILLLSTLCLLRDFSWKYYRRMYMPETYHYIQEIQKYNIADHQPRMDQFQRAIRKARQVQRMRKQRGFAFSQSDEGQDKVIRAYDTSKTNKRLF